MSVAKIKIREQKSSFLIFEIIVQVFFVLVRDISKLECSWECDLSVSRCRTAACGDHARYRWG